MSKLGVKRFLVLALIMASAVACMCAINVLPSKINTWFDNQRVEEDYLDIGLDYKDGWYLINDAEDYYLMADLVNADMAQGAKFKIMNDITVDSRRASINNFSNATLEGNGYNINMELLPEYEPDINAMAVNLNGRDKSAGLKYTSPQSIIDGGDWSIYGVSVAACLASSGLGVTNGSGYMGTYDDSIVGSSRDTWIINAKKYSINNSATFNLAYSENSTEYTTLHHVNMGIAVGGVFGVVKDATVQNVYVTISKPIILGVGSTVNQWLILGGLVGVAYNSTIQYCVVDFVDSGDLNLQPCDDSGVADTQDDSGECEKSSNTSIGGLVGHAHGSTITKNVVIYKKDTTPNFSKYGYYTGLVGSNTNTKDGEGVVYTYLVDDQKASLHMDDQDYEFSSEVSIPAKTASNECWIMYKSDSSGNLINNGKIIQSCFVDSVAPTYITITANPNGGTISSLNGWTSSGTNATKKIEQGTKIGNLPVATLSGYEFAGWYTSKTGGSQVTENETFSSTTTIYAHWESSSITVTAHTNGSGTYSSIESLMYGWTRVDDYTATRVMEEGEKFNDFPYIKCYDARYTVSTIDGWNTKANGSGVTIGYSTLFDPSTMLDIYAQQKLRSFLITFDLQGGEVLSYYADNADGYNKEYYGGKSTELYFSKPANTAYYDAGETFTLPTATQTIRGNCVFKGWKISKVETLGINDSISTDWAMTVNEVDFEPGAQISKKHGAITLTAVWEECVITWDYNEEGIENWEQSYVYSDAIELPENTKDILGGMYISKWIVIVADGTWTEGAEYEAGTSKTNMWGHVTLQAVWEYISYIIYLEVDDGEIYSAVIDYQPSGDIASYENYKITYNVKTEFALPKALNGDKVEISKPGYKFLGWQFKDTGEPHNIDFVYNEDSTYITRVNKGSYGDATLKAVWELVEYTMTLQLDADENTLAQLIAYTPVNSSTGDEISYELVDNSVTGGKNIVFTYNINYAFELPKAEEIKKAGYSFLGWNWINEDDLMNVIGSESNGYYTSISAGTYGDVVLLAIWEPNGYSITINGNGGTIDGNGSIKIEYSIEGMTSSVMLLSESQKVYLPSLDSWEYEGHVPLYYQLAGAEGEHNWGEIGTQYPSGADVTGKYGDVNLIVVWREIIYNIQLIKGTGDVTNIEGINYNDGITFPDIHNKETASVMVAGTSYDIDWASGLSRDKYIFIGWSVMSSLNHGEGMTYIQAGEYLAIDIVEGILQSGSVSQLTATDKVTVSIYAIWLPIYEVTVESSGAEIYDNGTKVTDKTYFIVTNNYREGYEIYSQEDRDLFYAPTRTGYGLHKFGYEITGWAVTVGGTRCYTSLPNPTLTDWLVDNEGKLVSSGTNLQYLQGNIVLTPNWAPVTLDVRVKTESSEGYKEGYNQVKVTPIVFDTDYAMSETSLNIEITNILATDIIGYKLIYAHPYQLGSIDTEQRILLNKVWDYQLMYSQYTITDGLSPSSEGVRWYVEVEGYYAPDLYQLEIVLDLPYTSNNSFNVNGNGYTLTSTFDMLQQTYGAVIWQNGGWVDSVDYLDKQHKLYEVNGRYYIYLLQDYIIELGNVYDRYVDGKESKGEGYALPIFEINYYQMPYYYTLNNEASASLYQVMDTDEYKTDVEKYLNEKSVASINYVQDWRYKYCHTNETPNDNYEYFKLYIYWYRNVLNVDISNLLDTTANPEGENTFNGYALIEEVEQVTGELKEHSKYHLVIYTLTNDVYSYTIYGFNEDMLTGATEKYEYTNILTLIELGDTRVKILDKDGDVTTKDLIPIYFGNTFKVQAVDQSKDHSLDEFIGYRFKEYKYTITNENGEQGTCSEIAEFDGFANNGEDYVVAVNLQEYEQGVNTTNYFEDKDVLMVDVHFEKIQYVLNYQVTDEDYTLTPEYGNIRLEYQLDLKEGYEIEYLVTVNYENVVSTRMNVRLGSEHIAWKLVMSNEEMDITQQDSQTCNILINPTFLRTHLYVGGDYSSKAEQKVGDVNAVCKDIEFGIKVNVTDVSTEEVIRSYTLTEEEQNTLFNLGTTKVVIGNEYTLKMLSKQLEDDYVYYKQDDKVYVVREIHLTPSLSHSTKMLVTTFDYPQTELESVEMLVNNELLDGSINYIQFTEVSEDNRYLVFNVEVAPTYELEFEVITNANDRFKQDRQVSVEKVVVASATEGQELTVVAGKKYIGYWGQETLFNFNASSLFYESAKLSIEYEEDAGREEDVLVNQGVKYTVNYDAKVTIELIPQIYSASTYVEYQGVRYSVTENYGANGELPIGELVNASGINIFEEYGIKVSSSSTTGKYYSGDEIRIKYELNAELADDFMVTVYNNETKLYEESTGEYIAKILDRDVEIKLEVQAVPDVVVLTTTYPKLEVGEIYALVNGDEKIKVEGEYTIINLINGDMLEVYIKEEIGFEFTGEYEHKAEICKAEESEGEGEWEGYKKIVMFSEGFELTKKGWYDLIFKQIPIEVEYKYYTVVPEVEEVLAGQGYTITADTTPIQKGTKVTLIKGEDNVGYRFDGYTYVSPKGEEGSKEFSLTEISDKEQEFSIDEEILRNLREEEGKLVLTVYVNYVRQYKYEYDYRCNSGEVRASVIGVSSGKAMQEGEYYDYGTKMQVRVETVDSKHYKINVEMTNAYGNEIFNTETIQAEEVEVVEGSVVNTNLGSVAGFGVVRELRSNEVIRLGVEVEKYDTILSQKLQKTLDEEAIGETTSLLNQGNGLFSLGDNIYYEIEGTHEYGTEIEVRIHVIMPEESTEQYYTLTGARVNGKEATIRKEGTSEIDGCGSEVYVLRYSLRGEIPTSMEVELDFVALYFVQVGVTE